MLCLWPKFFIYLLGLFESFFFSILFLIFPFFLDHTTSGSAGVIKKETQKSNQT